MSTLQEFLAYTKGWEYIIVVFFVSAFIVFWRLLTGEPGVLEENPAGDEAPGREEGESRDVISKRAA